MNCKYCGYLLEDGDQSKDCPVCGKPLFDDDVTEAVDVEVEEEFDEEAETNDLEQESDLESEMEEFEDEVYERTDSEEDTDTEPVDTYDGQNMENEEIKAQEPKKRGGLVIAAIAGVFIIGCVIIVMAVTSLQKKKDSKAADEAKEQIEVNQNTSDDEKKPEDSTAEDDKNIGDYSEYEQYITKLADYVGVEVSMVPEEVTDEILEQEIQTRLQRMVTKEEIKDRDQVQEGDIANIDFTGYIDGKEFDNGAAKGEDLQIGSGRFIPGFEDQLIGVKVGDTVDINVTFPEDYKKDMAGKAAVFKVKVNGIYQEVVPELTDDWCAKNTESKTTEEYRASIRNELEQVNLNTVKNTKADRVLTSIYENSTFKSFPEGEVEKFETRIRSNYEYMATMQGAKLEDLIKANGMNQEEFDKSINEAAEKNAGIEIICYCIANKEGMKLTDEEYQEELKKYAEQYQAKSPEDFEKQCGKKAIYNAVIMDKVLKLVEEKSVEVQK